MRQRGLARAGAFTWARGVDALLAALDRELLPDLKGCQLS